MRKIMDRLLALQKLQFAVRGRPAAARAELEKLRAEVPLPLLAHYDRLVACGKRGVAIARDGVCSECHLRITAGKIIGLSAGIDIQVCDNCGRYLYLPEAAPVGLAETKALPTVASKRTHREAVRHIA